MSERRNDLQRRLNDKQQQLNKEDDKERRKQLNFDMDILRHQIEIERIREIKRRV